MMMSSSMVMRKDNFIVLGYCCIIRYMRVHHRYRYTERNTSPCWHSAGSGASPWSSDQ
jgi:hypothetical protein